MALEKPAVNEQETAAPKWSRKIGATGNLGGSRLQRRVAFLSIVMPALGVTLAIALLFVRPLSATDLILFAVMYTLTTFGVVIGLHRMASHRAFQTYAPIRALLAILGSMGAQGPVLYWAAIHRRHHQHSDDEGDPHSPHACGHGFVGILKGIWHVHVGWAFAIEPIDWGRWIPDLLRDRTLLRVNQLYFVWVGLGLVIPAVIGGLVSESWLGAVTGFLWGGLVRMFLLQNSIAGVNSIAHLWGPQPYRSHDSSRNNALLAVFTLGDGWHNNHHAFPNSASNTMHWWQLDVCAWVIRTLQLCRLAWDVKYPSAAARLDARRLRVTV
jgi:stearoyl-CoA desaturase (delta-9 desaturase)